MIITEIFQTNYKLFLPLSKVEIATKVFVGETVRCLIGAGRRGRYDLFCGLLNNHFTRTLSPPPVYMWPPKQS